MIFTPRQKVCRMLSEVGVITRISPNRQRSEPESKHKPKNTGKTRKTDMRPKGRALKHTVKGPGKLHKSQD